MLFTIESSKYTPNECQSKILQFITDLQSKLTIEMYQNFVDGLIIRKSEPFKDIYQEMSYIMSALKTYSCNMQTPFEWDKKAKEVAYLRNSLTFEMVVETFSRLLIDPATTKRVAFRTYP